MGFLLKPPLPELESSSGSSNALLGGDEEI
jgi:hypothetical protein